MRVLASSDVSFLCVRRCPSVTCSYVSTYFPPLDSDCPVGGGCCGSRRRRLPAPAGAGPADAAAGPRRGARDRLAVPGHQRHVVGAFRGGGAANRRAPAARSCRLAGRLQRRLPAADDGRTGSVAVLERTGAALCLSLVQADERLENRRLDRGAAQAATAARRPSSAAVPATAPASWRPTFSTTPRNCPQPIARCCC